MPVLRFFLNPIVSNVLTTDWFLKKEKRKKKKKALRPQMFSSWAALVGILKKTHTHICSTSAEKSLVVLKRYWHPTCLFNLWLSWDEHSPFAKIKIKNQKVKSKVHKTCVIVSNSAGSAAVSGELLCLCRQTADIWGNFIKLWGRAGRPTSSPLLSGLGNRSWETDNAVWLHSIQPLHDEEADRTPSFG